MPKTETQKAIIAKLNKLNKIIDLKIITAQDWRKEAKEHKKLFIYLTQTFN